MDKGLICYLGDQTIQIGVGWTIDAKFSATDIVDGLIVDHESAIRMVNGRVGCQNGVVRLNNSGGDLRRWIDGELEFRLFPVFERKALHKQRGEA